MLVRPNWISGVVILAVKPSSRTLSQSGQGRFHPRHTLQSYYDQTPPFIYQCNLLWQRLLLLGQIFILGLGHRPNIWINNELLGPRTLQVPCERILIFPILSHLKTNEKLNFIILNYTPNYNLHLKLWISVQVNIKLNVGVQSVTIVII